MVKQHKWILPLASVAFAAAALALYTLLREDRTPLMYVQVTAAALVPWILPIAGTVAKREFPPAVNLLITIHVFLASTLGSALDFYARFAYWDLVMHGYFGFVAATVLYMLLLKWNTGARGSCGRLALIFLAAMGCAAVWEIFEFSADALLGCDAQRVQEALRLGISPVTDTMTDIIAAAAGVAVFYALLMVDRFFSRSLIKRLCVPRSAYLN